MNTKKTVECPVELWNAAKAVASIENKRVSILIQELIRQKVQQYPDIHRTLPEPCVEARVGTHG